MMSLATGSKRIVANYNPNHDDAGRFSSGAGGGGSGDDIGGGRMVQQPPTSPSGPVVPPVIEAPPQGPGKPIGTGSKGVKVSVGHGVKGSGQHTILVGTHKGNGEYDWTIVGRRAQLGNAQRDAKKFAVQHNASMGSEKVIVIGDEKGQVTDQSHAFFSSGTRVPFKALRDLHKELSGPGMGTPPVQPPVIQPPAAPPKPPVAPPAPNRNLIKEATEARQRMKTVADPLSSKLRNLTGPSARGVAVVVHNVIDKMPHGMAIEAAKGFHSLRAMPQAEVQKEWELSRGNGEKARITVAGWYNHTLGEVMLTTDTPDALGTVAHELTHAVDRRHVVTGANGVRRYAFPHSDTPAWKSAWGKEIVQKDEYGGVRLTKYATTNSCEGFAEFGRLVALRPEVAQRNYPKCWAYWQQQGLV